MSTVGDNQQLRLRNGIEKYKENDSNGQHSNGHDFTKGVSNGNDHGNVSSIGNCTYGLKTEDFSWMPPIE